jgi:hypothetical protein
MGMARRVFGVSIMLLVALGATALTVDRAAADGSTRHTKIQVSYTQYTWWLLRWDDNQVVCTLITDHEGLPTGLDIYNSCSYDVYLEWLNTKPCKTITDGGDDVSSCSGLYLFQVASEPKQKEIEINLPPAMVWLSLDGCNPEPPENFCAQMPSVKFTGEEPLPNEKITSINGTFDGQPFTCEGDTCLLPLRATPEAGVTVDFWASSSFGDNSQVFTAKVRVVDSGVSATPGKSGYYVDVISTQWRGNPVSSCVQTWGAFPPAGGTTDWLSTPQDKLLLASDGPYYYLAGRLISQGIVVASNCPAGGLLANGYADACGLEAARPLVEAWQNQFDNRIIQTAGESGVPAQLLKNLFAQESQFWPGVFRVTNEFGLGQITDMGADTILLWNDSFYQQFCPLVLAEDTCSQGYMHLTKDQQALLRGALAVQAKADCPDCVTGVDLVNTNFSVGLFAKTLQANCEQVAQIVVNATTLKPGDVSSYQDLWRFTVANYHAGPGCLSYAINLAWNANKVKLLWSEVATFFTDPCKGVIPYVDKITK